MDKESVLAWMQVMAYFIIFFIVAVAFLWFGSVQYVVLSAVFLGLGISGTALSLACHDVLKSPRLVFFLVEMAGGALLLALPYA